MRAPTASASDCQSPSPALAAEIDRLLESAGGHATYSEVCADGMGERTRINRTSACVVEGQKKERVTIRYHVSVSQERGGECTPYPACAQPPPPTESDQSLMVEVVRVPSGVQLVVPVSVPGVTLKTPLDQKHQTGCDGVIAAFVPRVLAIPGAKR